ncbi:OPT oligopeptide transporter [Coniella lustricola]|uniref:OPT oligopeptide transporter n=1 Tax=Coniella lustricola TaxID=2025994 RepID=A0A2T3AJ54_9PEZI|nr:OPT oligopeptide transporter [Coniella lustricola]
MAPDRGVHDDHDAASASDHDHARLSSDATDHGHHVQSAARPGLEVASRSFTLRGVAAGLVVGLVICFSNMYFGLQTGWVSMMTMPASLMGFGIFKTLARHLELPFTPVENVLVQTVAGSMAIMPLGCGFVGVLPAMNYLLKTEEQGPIHLRTWQLIVWSLGLCYFGVVFAVPLRRQVIVREKLKFPSGFSTAVLISVLHGTTGLVREDSAAPASTEARRHNGAQRVLADEAGASAARPQPANLDEASQVRKQQWKDNVRLLLLCFFVSGLYTFATYFFPILRELPVFGTTAASAWLWTLNPSLAYVGQGIIMGPATTIHMLLGAILGWGILSPLAKYKGWAPGRIDDWENGSKGWIVWTSLAIMLADAVVSLGYLAFRPLGQRLVKYAATKWHLGDTALGALLSSRPDGYTVLHHNDQDDHETEDENQNRQSYDSTRTTTTTTTTTTITTTDPADDTRAQAQIADMLAEANQDDAPEHDLISNRTVALGLFLSIAFCILCIHVVFGDLVPLYATIAAVLMALLLSIMGVRALGETDLNPVSGISKLAQLFFALIIPQSHPTSVLINLVAGAVSEAGALQAGDLMQDLKTGHLLGAAPKAQFWGQVIGATCGAVVSAFIYRLYTAVYTIPGSLFQVPTAYVWIFTARLVTGQGLPYMAREWAIAFAALFTLTTAVRIYGANKTWQVYVPGGIAVAVGMYNVPSFTLARTVGGLIAWWWQWRGSRGGEQNASGGGKEGMGGGAVNNTPLIVLASGFILGEGFLSIVNLIMQSLRVPHL